MQARPALSRHDLVLMIETRGRAENGRHGGEQPSSEEPSAWDETLRLCFLPLPTPTPTVSACIGRTPPRRPADGVRPTDRASKQASSEGKGREGPSLHQKSQHGPVRLSGGSNFFDAASLNAAQSSSERVRLYL